MSRQRKPKEAVPCGPSANVQVALRIRPLTDKEKKNNGGSCLKYVNGEKSLVVKGKVYGQFDQVFNETSTQPEVYDKVARQQVELVMQGYNCTLFAYGQTGTGKTYCMEGGAEHAYTGDWQSDPELGIIPRSIEHVFNVLEKEGMEEFCVRVSYVELYNEELYDLLAPNVDDSARIRLYEDPTKKGSVIVSGAEEVPVRTRAEVFRLLQRGAERKTMAATLMNNRSSRSHCVFTVTVVVRETSLEGEELVRQGKLNLVDLAGSESIGRSGAEGRRAKEAGSINQSLLTLGRCITSLTTNAGHVPYRESKLTRLLQDSLGGSTITTIIATISPSTSNYEETVSTLEYASRAKNIKNHPEVNEKVSRKAALKEMSDVIERLQRDLRNAREKNGIYLSEESLKGMEDKIRDQQKFIEELEGQLTGVVNKLHLMVEDMAEMDDQYRMLYERKQRVEERLAQRVDEVESTKKDLAEANQRCEALEKSVHEMHRVAMKLRFEAQELQRTSTEASMDVDLLWEKLASVFSTFDANIIASKRISDFVTSAAAGLHSKTDGGHTREMVFLDQLHSLFGNLDKEVQQTLDQMNIRHTEIASALSNTITGLQVHIEETLSAQKDASMRSSATITDSVDKLQAVCENIKALIGQFLPAISTSLQTISDRQKVLTAEVSNLAHKEIDAVTTEKEATLEAHNLNRERVKGFTESLTSQMNDLISNFTNDLFSSMDVLETRCADNATERQQALHKFDNLVSKETERTITDALGSITSSTDLVTALHEKCNSLLTSGCEIRSVAAEAQCSFAETLDECCAHAKKIQTEHENVSQSGQSYHSSTVSTLRETVVACKLRGVTFIEEEKSAADSVKDEINKIRDNMNQRAREHVEEEVTLISSSGNTPRKRKYDIIEECEFVPRVERLLSEHGYDRPARRSLYTTRDSILTENDPAMSPQSVFKKRKVPMDDIPEGDESGSTANSSVSSRRVLRDSN